MINLIKTIIKKRDYIADSDILLRQIYYKYFTSDVGFLKKRFKKHFNSELNLESPKTFNEKLQWLKLYDRNPIYTQLVDKYGVRNYIAEKLGTQYLVPILGVYDSFDEINFDKLPNKFVLKCTHDSGGLIICEDKKSFDIETARKKINRCLKINYYYLGREWPYKNIKPRIICEEFLSDGVDKELKDYRFFCFDGKPRFVAVDFSITDKTKTRRNLYDLEWNLMNEEISYSKELIKEVPKPKKLDEMIKLSEILSKDIPHVRVDIYSLNEKIYFGEMTFYHQSGYGNIKPHEFDIEMGSWIKLPKSNI